MTQKDLFGWEVVQEQIDKNKEDRLNWKSLLGMSLNQACAKFKSSGLDVEQVYDVLVLEHPDWSEEVKRRLKIGVCARYGEMSISQKELKK